MGKARNHNTVTRSQRPESMMVDYDTAMALLAKEKPTSRRPWAEDDLRVLEEGRKKGYSYPQIAKVLDRKTAAVSKMATEKGLQ